MTRTLLSSHSQCTSLSISDELDCCKQNIASQSQQERKKLTGTGTRSLVSAKQSALTLIWGQIQNTYSFIAKRVDASEDVDLRQVHLLCEPVTDDLLLMTCAYLALLTSACAVII